MKWFVIWKDKDGVNIEEYIDKANAENGCLNIISLHGVNSIHAIIHGNKCPFSLDFEVREVANV